MDRSSEIDPTSETDPVIYLWSLNLIYTFIYIISGALLFKRYRSLIVWSQYAIIFLTLLNLMLRNVGGFLEIFQLLPLQSGVQIMILIVSPISAASFLLTFHILTMKLEVERLKAKAHKAEALERKERNRKSDRIANSFLSSDDNDSETFIPENQIATPPWKEVGVHSTV